MNERNERIEKLLERYYDALTSDAEERELRDYFRRTAEVPAHLRQAALLFGGFDALGEEHLPAGRTIVLRRRISPLWGAAAAAAVVLLGIVLYAQVLRTPYCYIDGVAVYDREVALRTTDYLDAFSHFNDPAGMVDDLLEHTSENK